MTDNLQRARKQVRRENASLYSDYYISKENKHRRLTMTLPKLNGGTNTEIMLRNEKYLISSAVSLDNIFSLVGGGRLGIRRGI